MRQVHRVRAAQLRSVIVLRREGVQGDVDGPAAPARRQRRAAHVAEGAEDERVEAADDVADARAEFGVVDPLRVVAAEEERELLAAESVRAGWGEGRINERRHTPLIRPSGTFSPLRRGEGRDG